MLEIIQKILKKEESTDASGFLTKEEILKLKSATMQKASEHRKRSYKTWNCAECGHEFYYTVLKCPACESGRIENVEHKTLYYPSDINETGETGIRAE